MRIKKKNGPDYYKITVNSSDLSFSDLFTGANPKDCCDQFILAPYVSRAAVLSGNDRVRVRSRSFEDVELRWPAIIPSKMVLTAIAMFVAAFSAVKISISVGSFSGFELIRSIFILIVLLIILGWLVIRLATDVAFPANCVLTRLEPGLLRMSCQKHALHWPYIGVAEVNCNCDAIIIIKYEKPHMKSLPFYRGVPIQYAAFLASLDGYVFQIAESRSSHRIARIASVVIGASPLLAELPVYNRCKDVSLVVGELPLCLDGR